ncbi:nucleoredoxin-like protein 2 [Mizuhopecten yessoensis]|uniref:nucleoredoxin-like protein 2 n=1 Tax=Mizuhopecten yessoensis TaxID=6573 RepID=UPI000B459534|nr:nucleoredoxin-like protein 2 [Mizuhopecten yessoensis]
MNNITNEEEVIKTFEDLLVDKELLTSNFFIVPEEKIFMKEEEREIKEDTNEQKGEDAEDVKHVKEELSEQITDKENETKDTDGESNTTVNNGRVEALKAIEKKLVGLYFSAGWCPPCRQFTPLLKDFYEETQRRSAPFEVVFVSCDKKEEDMASYYRESHGDWLVVPFGDQLQDDLKTRFNITAVPKLIIVNNAGDVITLKGRKEIQDKGIVCFRTWQEIATFRENRSKSQASAAGLTDSKEEEGDKSTQA